MAERRDDPALGTLEFEPTGYVPPMGPHLSRRARARRVAVIVAAVLVALSGMVWSIPALRTGLVARFIGGPRTPAPFNPAAISGVYFQPNVPWARVLVDGQALEDVPQATQRGTPLTLARGTHQITWQAEPFQPITCALPVPRASLEATLTGAGHCDLHPWYGSVPGLLLGERDSLAALPADQQAALRAALQAGLSASAATVELAVGTRYVATKSDSPFGLNSADEPLRATLSFTLASGWSEPCTLSRVQPCRFPFQDCQQICTLPETVTTPGNTRDWMAAVPVMETWTFTTLDGRVVERAPASPTLNYALAVVRITYTEESWQVTPLFGHAAADDYADDAACVAGREAMYAYHDATTGPLRFSVDLASASYRAGPNVTDGCAILATATPITSSSPAGSQQAIFLERFGVLLAVNGMAEGVAPGMPRATPDEVALARGLLAAGGVAMP